MLLRFVGLLACFVCSGVLASTAFAEDPTSARSDATKKCPEGYVLYGDKCELTGTVGSYNGSNGQGSDEGEAPAASSSYGVNPTGGGASASADSESDCNEAAGSKDIGYITVIGSVLAERTAAVRIAELTARLNELRDITNGIQIGIKQAGILTAEGKALLTELQLVAKEARAIQAAIDVLQGVRAGAYTVGAIGGVIVVSGVALAYPSGTAGGDRERSDLINFGSSESAVDENGEPIYEDCDEPEQTSSSSSSSSTSSGRPTSGSSSSSDDRSSSRQDPTGTQTRQER